MAHAFLLSEQVVSAVILQSYGVSLCGTQQDGRETM